MEINFVRRILVDMFQTELTDGGLVFPWGTVWSGFDPKGFSAATASAIVRLEPRLNEKGAPQRPFPGQIGDRQSQPPNPSNNAVDR